MISRPKTIDCEKLAKTMEDLGTQVTIGNQVALDNPLLRSLIRRIRVGEFSYGNITSDYPISWLVEELLEAGLVILARRVMMGEFDELPDEVAP